MKITRVPLIVLAFLFSSMSISWAQVGGALSFATGWQKKLGSELSLKPAWQKKPASELSLKPGSQKKPGSGLSLANGWQQKMEWQNKKDQLDLGYYEVAQAQGVKSEKKALRSWTLCALPSAPCYYSSTSTCG